MLKKKIFIDRFRSSSLQKPIADGRSETFSLPNGLASAFSFSSSLIYYKIFRVFSNSCHLDVLGTKSRASGRFIRC
jgi:hypothetical protein